LITWDNYYSIRLFIEKVGIVVFQKEAFLTVFIVYFAFANRRCII